VSLLSTSRTRPDSVRPRILIIVSNGRTITTMHLLRLRPPRPRRLAFHRVPRRVVLAPVSVDTIDLALHTVLAQAAAAGLSRQEARACVVELGQLARMPESAPAPRAWRGGGLPKLCAPSEGLLGDVIVNASEIVQTPEEFHALKPAQFFFTFPTAPAVIQILTRDLEAIGRVAQFVPVPAVMCAAYAASAPIILNRRIDSGENTVPAAERASRQPA